MVNAPLLADTETFRKSLNKEVDYVVHGQRGMTQRVPHALYWNVFRDNTTPSDVGAVAGGVRRLVWTAEEPECA